MQTNYRVLFPNGGVQHGSMEWPEHPERDLIGALVLPWFSDEPIELVSLSVDGQLVDMVIAEMGHMRLTSRARLAFNDMATELYRDSYARLYPDNRREDMPTIAGAAVVFERLLR